MTKTWCPALVVVALLFGASSAVFAQPPSKPEAEPAPIDTEALRRGSDAEGEARPYENPTWFDPKYAPPVVAEPAPVDLQNPAAPGSGAEPASGKYDQPAQVGVAGSANSTLSALGLGDLQLRWSGRIEASLHHRTERKTFGAFYDSRALPASISRYETTLNLRLEAVMRSFRGVADIDFDWLGYGEERFHGFTELSERQAIQPVRFEAHALYLEAADLLLDGLDLKFGQQLVQWGVADQFNPTNVVNSEDLENVLRFGQQVANLALRVDYTFFDTWSVSGVVVPVFKPAILPRSAALGAAAVDRLPFVDENTRLLLHTERDFAANLDAAKATVVKDIVVREPAFDLANMQYALRVGGEFFGQDLSLMYYLGRNDIPVAIGNHISQRDQEVCLNPQDPNSCIAGFLDNTVTLAYPRFQMLGFNLAGEIPFLLVGYRVELGVFFPFRRRAKITNDDLSVLIPGFIDRPAGEYDYEGVTPDGGRPVVLTDTPFAKWTVGLDYSIGEHVYLNVMWVHGFPDEFGAGDTFGLPGRVVRSGGLRDPINPAEVEFCVFDRDGTACAQEILRPNIGDYLIVGTDVKLFDQQLTLRMFAILELTGYEMRTYDPDLEQRVTTSYSAFSEEGFSAVLYPEISYNFGNGLELGGGALFQLGRSYTKFGDPATGGSLAFIQGKYGF